MRRNAIVRIIIYSVLLLVLTLILIVAIAPDFWMKQLASGDNVATEGRAPATVRRLEIDWAGGSVTIKKGTDKDIWFYESAPDGCRYNMHYEQNEYTLSIQYRKGAIVIGKMPAKDLVIQVPQDWGCEELEIDGAGLDITIEDVDLHTLELDGAGCTLSYSGSVIYVDVDGAGTTLELNCAGKPEQIDIDGMGCELNLKLPTDCGFSVNSSGLGCTLNTDLSFEEKNGRKVHGNGECAIEVNGLGCSVTIAENGKCAHVWDAGLFPTASDMNIAVYTCRLCGVTKSEPDNHEHLWQELPLDVSDTQYICSVCGITRPDPVQEEYAVIIARPGVSVTRTFGKFAPGDTVTYRTQRGDAKLLLYIFHEETYYEGTVTEDGFWEFTFTMPKHNVTIMAVTEQEKD